MAHIVYCVFGGDQQTDLEWEERAPRRALLDPANPLLFITAKKDPSGWVAEVSLHFFLPLRTSLRFRLSISRYTASAVRPDLILISIFF